MLTSVISSTQWLGDRHGRFWQSADIIREFRCALLYQPTKQNNSVKIVSSSTFPNLSRVSINRAGIDKHKGLDNLKLSNTKRTYKVIKVVSFGFQSGDKLNPANTNCELVR